MTNASARSTIHAYIIRCWPSGSSIRSGYQTAVVLGLVLCTVFTAGLGAATGTLMPTPYQTLLDANGNPVSNGKICTYIAGTTTPAPTYTDVSLSTPNLNPIRSDTTGRFVVYLSPGASYKFVYQDSTGTAGVCDGAAIKTVDNVSAVPAASVNLDVTGTAGETLTAGQTVYLSDGSGAKTAGLWYKADSANTYSSSAAVTVGMAPGAITSLSSGTIRLAGQVTGLSSLTIGTKYYVGTAGALTASGPTNLRVMGIADTTSSLLLNANPATPNADNGVECFRLTLTTGVPVTVSDVTAATTIYASPHGCNRIALFDALGNPTIATSAEFSLAVPATTVTTYDIFAYLNASGAPTLEFLAWTNDTTRATAVVLTTTGTYTKSGDLTRRFLGSFRTTGVSGQTEDSMSKRFLSNYYHRVRRTLKQADATASWSYSTATIRQVRATATNQVEVVVGIAEVTLTAWYASIVANDNATLQPHQIGIGIDSTTAFAANGQAQVIVTGPTANEQRSGVAHVEAYPAVGYHTVTMLERGTGTGTSTWYGTTTYPGIATLLGWIEG